MFVNKVRIILSILVLSGLVLISNFFYGEFISAQEAKASQQAFSAKFPHSTLIEGEVDELFLEKVINSSSKTDNLVIHSGGGASQTALEVANVIRENNYSVTIPYLCISACAELILPAANKIIFSDQPLIGYHGNTLAYANYIKAKTGNADNYCNLRHSLMVKLFYLKRETPIDFWREVYRRLEIDKMELRKIDGGDCITINIKTKHKFWYPNSQQLEEVFGLNFSGNVCADSPACYKEKLSKRFPVGTSLVVGDTIFTVGSS